VSRIRRLVAATLLGAAAVPLATAPAHAAACSGSQGVTVVVGSSVRCDADGGGRAASNFTDAGHRLTYATRAAGFVCRVDGAPASDPCLEASPVDAYWALFWSDGTSGAWTYATQGATSLRVPQGGSVAFVFQSSASRTWPSVKPHVVAAEAAPAAPRPSATQKSQKSPGAPTRKAERPRATTRPAATATASPRPGATAPSATPSPTASASTATPTTSTPSSAAPQSDEATEAAPAVTPLGANAEPASTSRAATVVAAGVMLVLAAAGGVAWFRRRTG